MFCVHVTGLRRHMTKYSPGDYPRIFPNFQSCVCCEKYMTDNKHNSVHLAQIFSLSTIASILSENMLGYLSLVIICSSKHTVFLELCSRKTVSFSEQIFLADKYSCIFSWKMGAIVDKENIYIACVTGYNVTARSVLWFLGKVRTSSSCILF